MRFFCSFLVGLASLLLCAAAALGAGSSGKPNAVIACFHPRVATFTPEAHPGDCHIRGRRGKEVVDLPIVGMKWGHWGARHTRAGFGSDVRDGRGVRVVAYQLKTCADGLTWYSKAVVVFPGDGSGFEVRLPTCSG
jgi:hypothetical protein